MDCNRFKKHLLTQLANPLLRKWFFWGVLFQLIRHGTTFFVIKNPDNKRKVLSLAQIYHQAACVHSNLNIFKKSHNFLPITSTSFASYWRTSCDLAQLSS